MWSKRLRTIGAAIFSFGAEGLNADEARKVNIVTVGCIVTALFMPGYSVVTLVASPDIPFVSWPVLTPLGLGALYLIPLSLLYARRRLAAKLCFLLLVNAHNVAISMVYGFDVGSTHFLFALGLIPFLIFRGSRPVWLLLLLLLPLSLYFVAQVFFQQPLGGIYEVPERVIRNSNTFNLVVAYAVTVLVVYLFYDMLSRAEIRLAQFSGDVSEYLDADLVARIRDRVDVRPEVRFLTVFFADLIGSTRTSFAMNKEQFGEMINDYVKEMQTIIKSHRGYIEDVSGDGIMGYVGNFDSAGRARDALDAVALCVEMRARLAELAPRYRRLYGLPNDLGVRIGVSSGEATVGKTPGARAIYTANGEAVNLAAKLEKKVTEIAPAGGILIGQATAELIDSAYPLEPHVFEIEGARVTAFAVDCQERSDG